MDGKMPKNRVDEFIRDPKRAIFVVALPVIVSMLVQTLYNIVDTAFVGRLGADAIAGLTFAFPVFFILIAINVGMSTGMGSRISRFMGQKKKDAAENAAMHGMVLSLAVGALLIIAGFLFLDDIFLFFGAYNSALQLSMDYMSIILIGIVFMFPAFVLSTVFASQGDTKTPMKVQIAALGLNIILDPIFIYVLGFGVRGAAMATVISFFVSLLLYIYFLKTRSYLELKLCCFRFRWYMVKEILKVGAPASLMMLMMSFYFMFINKFMAGFSTDHVAAFGIVSRLEAGVFMPIAGFAWGLMTIVGMFYGAKKYDLMEGIIWYAIRIGMAVTASAGAILFIAPQIFLRIFTTDQSLIAMGIPYVRITVFAIPLWVVSLMISRALQGMGLGLPGLLINFARSIAVALPVAYVLIYIHGHGYLSIALSVVIGAVSAAILASVWLKLKMRRLLRG